MLPFEARPPHPSCQGPSIPFLINKEKFQGTLRLAHVYSSLFSEKVMRVCAGPGGMVVPLWIRPEYIKATLFKSVPKSSWWKTPLKEHNNGLQCFPSVEGERPVTARAEWGGLSCVSVYGQQTRHKNHFFYDD